MFCPGEPLVMLPWRWISCLGGDSVALGVFSVALHAQDDVMSIFYEWIVTLRCRVFSLWRCWLLTSTMLARVSSCGLILDCRIPYHSLLVQSPLQRSMYSPLLDKMKDLCISCHVHHCVVWLGPRGRLPGSFPLCWLKPRCAAPRGVQQRGRCSHSAV